MPIRLRLTLWYCLIFGMLLVAITSVTYFVHRSAHYTELDRLLENISFHVENEIERELQQGKTLQEATIFFSPFYLEGVSFAIIDKYGKQIQSSQNYDRTIERPLTDIADIQEGTWDSIDYPSMGRFRTFIRPVTLNGGEIIYIFEETPLKRLDNTIHRLRWLILGITGVGLVIAAFAGWILARQTLNPIEIIRQTAQAIAASQGFSQRVLYEGPKDELGELADTFNEMLGSLEKAYVSQRRFIADASHELRAPLTTIRGNLDILQRSKNITPEEQQEILQDLRSESIRMSKLVTELLSLARADVGQEVKMEIVNLSEMANAVYMEVNAWGENIRMVCEVGSSVMTWGNTDLLKQLLLIMMENAVKYTPEGGTVTLRCYQEGEYAVIVVADTGIGIKQEELQLIFERFYRSDAARVQSPDGTGLGLSIAKWIIDDHNGNIIVTSVLGEGSEFHIYLPRVR